MKEIIKNNFKIIILLLILLLLAYNSEKNGTQLLDGSSLERNAYGDGEKKVDLILNADGLEEDYPYELTVEEIRITEKDAQKYFEQAKEEIDATIYTDGDTATHVEHHLKLGEKYADGLVKAEWTFLESRAVNYDGEILQKEIVKSGELVNVQVELTCKDYKQVYDFYIQVYPLQLSARERLLFDIRKAITDETEQFDKDTLTLPKTVDGVKLHWSEPKKYMVLKILGLEIVILIALGIARKEREKDAFKKRQESMRMDYSDIVSKMAILAGAGMSMRQAWDTISARYMDGRRKNQVKEKPAYEEMVVTTYEMQDGASERTAFQNFAERVGVGEYHRLSRILVQSIQKGNKGICGMLEKEAADAFESRKLMARKLGEEASTKMMIPLMLMLGIVMAVIMVPALLGMNVNI